MAPQPLPDDRDRPTDEALADLAHDFRDALASIIGRAQLLSRRMRTDRAGPEDVLEALAAIERAARRMAGGLARLEGGRGPPRAGATPTHLGAAPDHLPHDGDPHGP